MFLRGCGASRRISVEIPRQARNDSLLFYSTYPVGADIIRPLSRICGALSYAFPLRVRVSGGHLREAKAPTEPTGETGVCKADG